jgi:hypothetical protein
MSSNDCKFCGVDVKLFRWCQNQTCKLYNTRVPAVRGFAFGSALCKACKGILSTTNPCPECLRNEPEALLKRFEEADKDALKAELGYSSEVEWRVFKEDAAISVGREWKGYKLELLGIELGRYSDWPIPPEGREFYAQVGAIASRDDGGYDIIRPWLLLPFSCIHDVVNLDLIIKLCRIRAFYKSSPLYSEMRSHAFGVRRVAIHGLEHKHAQTDLDKAVKGLDLLRAARKKLGRPKGTRFYSRADFMAAAASAYRLLYSLAGEHPKAYQIAEEMGLSKSAFHDALSEYELHVNDIRASAPRE